MIFFFIPNFRNKPSYTHNTPSTKTKIEKIWLVIVWIYSFLTIITGALYVFHITSFWPFIWTITSGFVINAILIFICCNQQKYKTEETK